VSRNATLRQYWSGKKGSGSRFSFLTSNAKENIMFDWLRIPLFKDRLVPAPEDQSFEPEAIVATCDVQELDSRLAEQCTPKTKWWFAYSKALKVTESLAEAIERVYNTNRDDLTDHCYDCGKNEPREWEHVPYSIPTGREDEFRDEDGDLICTIDIGGAYDTRGWDCPIPLDLFQCMIRVAQEEGPNAFLKPVPGEVLSAIDWALWRKRHNLESVREPVNSLEFSALEEPAKIGDIVRKTAVGQQGTFAPEIPNELMADVKEAMDLADGRTLDQISAECEVAMQGPETLPTRRRSLLFRIRCWIGMKIAALAVKVVPADKLEEIRYQEEEA
jgi:hypothetical protein